MIVDLRSDTVTLPTPDMLAAMMRAPLGDDVLGDDPSVHALEERSAHLAGKEAAVFVPSGTMANLIGIMVSTRPGDEVLLHQDAHPFHYEGAGSAVVAGVQLRTLPGPGGVIDPNDLATAVRPPDPHYPHTALLCVEDTHNRGGGTLQPPANTARLLDVARSSHMSAHLDGARVFNAAIAAGTTVADRARGFDTVSFCFSKALGCPAGSVVCGDQDRMVNARRHRKMLGGAMRQSGMLAGAALYALDHHVDRLADDHRRARQLAVGLTELGLDVPAPPSNIVVVQVPGAGGVASRLEESGVRCFPIGPDRLRLVVHLGITDEMIPTTIDAFRRATAA